MRVVGELLENQYRIGLVRMERAIKERMSLQEIETLMPHDLINSKPVSAVIKEFFGSIAMSLLLMENCFHAMSIAKSLHVDCEVSPSSC